MQRKIFVSAILALTLIVNIVSAEALINAGFDEGPFGQLPATIIPGWTCYATVEGGDSGWHCADGIYYNGTASITMWWDSVAFYQDFKCLEGNEYTVGISMISSSSEPLRGFDGTLTVEWLDEDYILIYDEVIGRFIGAKDASSEPGDALDVWKPVSNSITAPMGAIYGRVLCEFIQGDEWASSTGGKMYWDDATVTLSYGAESPEPANYASNLVPDTITELSWTRPAARQTGDTILCDVWFGTDPNMLVNTTKILDYQDANSVTISGLASDQDYYWRVDCYDPDGSGPEVKTEGWVWTFNTANIAPVVDAGAKQKVWLESGSATAAMAATVTDDGQPDPPAALTYSWTVLDGPSGVSFSPSSSVEDPEITFTAAGTYTLLLTASDSLAEANDVVVVNVYSQGYTGLIAYWSFDDGSGTTAVDSVGGHNGTLYGNPTWTTGKVGTALDFDGEGDYVDCGGGTTDHNSPTWADLTEELTVSVWMKGEFDSMWQSLITKGDNSWRLLRDTYNGETQNAAFACNGLTQVVSGSTGEIGDGLWHQVVGTYDGEVMCIYVDGILAQSASVPDGSIDYGDYDVRIASDAQNPADSREFNGLIDEVRIYEIGLPADMVLEQFIADGGSNSCGGNYVTGDLNKDCYVDFADFADFAENWLICNDVTNASCQ